MAGVSRLSPIDSFLSQTTKGERGKMSVLHSLSAFSSEGNPYWPIKLVCGPYLCCPKRAAKKKDVFGVVLVLVPG